MTPDTILTSDEPHACYRIPRALEGGAEAPLYIFQPPPLQKLITVTLLHYNDGLQRHMLFVSFFS